MLRLGTTLYRLVTLCLFKLEVNIEIVNTAQDEKREKENAVIPGYFLGYVIVNSNSRN